MAAMQIFKRITQPSLYTSGSEKKIVLFCILLAILICPSGAVSQGLVSGHYRSSSGNRIVLNLSISNPAPANLIVEQYLSADNSIVSTSPRAKKRSGGKLKWLFRNISPGRLTLSIQLQSSLKGTVRGVVRDRDPINGNFSETQIAP